jgi:hypothetical protein
MGSRIHVVAFAVATLHLLIFPAGFLPCRQNPTSTLRHALPGEALQLAHGNDYSAATSRRFYPTVPNVGADRKLAQSDQLCCVFNPDRDPLHMPSSSVALQLQFSVCSICAPLSKLLATGLHKGGRKRTSKCNRASALPAEL